MTVRELQSQLDNCDPEVRVMLAIGEERGFLEAIVDGALPMVVNKAGGVHYGIRAIVLMGSRINYDPRERALGVGV